MRYTILSYDNIPDLVGAINDKQREGWVCQGGATGLVKEQHRNSMACGYGTGFLFMQAIVKEGKS